MNIKNYFFVSLLFVGITFLFFNKTIFLGQFPFPGDLLIGEYAPYNSYSFLGYAPGGYPNKGQDFDVIRLLYPEKEFSIRMFKNFEFPFWNPYNFSGNPHIGSVQSGSFYPLNILFIALPFIYAWSAFIMLQPVLSGVFTFLFARELRLGLKSSIFSALVFAFSSYSIVWMEYGNIGHTILWMPFALWMSLKNLKHPSFLKSILISLALTFSIMAGYIQTSFYVYIFLGAFVFFNIFFINKEKKFIKLLLFFLIFTSSILLSSVQLFPTFELISQSARFPYSKSEFFNLLIPQFHAVSMFVPDFFGNPATRNYWISGTYIERVIYIGVLPLIFIIYGFFKKQKANFWFFVISAFVVLFLSFDTFFSRIIYSFDLPLISTAVPTRIVFIYCFSASILAGVGLEEYLKAQNKRNLLKSILAIGSIYVLLWIFVFIASDLFKTSSWVENLTISRRNLIFPTFIFLTGSFILVGSLYTLKLKKFIFTLLLLVAVLDLFYFFQKITPFAPIEAVYPKTEVLAQLKKIQGINRSWGYGNGYITTNLQTYEKTFSADGYNALHIKRYGELLSSSRDGRIASPIPRSDPMIASGFGGSDLRENKYRQRILDLLGVKYILNKVDPQVSTAKADNQTFDNSIYKLIWQQAPWQIYENMDALPRVFLASEYIVEKDKNKIIEMIFDDKFSLRNKIILEEDILPRINLVKDENTKVQIIKYTPNKIVLNTVSAENMLLFLSDNYYKGWRVSVDGENGKIYRANYSFRAVPILKGNHEVIFSYYPDSFNLGLKISLAATLAFAAFILIKKFIKINV